MVQNALAMIRQGWGKSEAIEMTLRAAGYRRSPASQLPPRFDRIVGLLSFLAGLRDRSHDEAASAASPQTLHEDFQTLCAAAPAC